jgi:hypothetical protein
MRQMPAIGCAGDENLIQIGGHEGKNNLQSNHNKEHQLIVELQSILLNSSWQMRLI